MICATRRIFLVLHKLAKKIFAVPGIATVQSITRPEGSPIERTSIPFQISLQSAGLRQIVPFAKDRMNGMLKQADDMQRMITQMEGTHNLMKLIGSITHNTVEVTGETAELTDDLMATVSNFDDFFRPIRNYSVLGRPLLRHSHLLRHSIECSMRLIAPTSSAFRCTNCSITW